MNPFCKLALGLAFFCASTMPSLADGPFGRGPLGHVPNPGCEDQWDKYLGAFLQLDMMKAAALENRTVRYSNHCAKGAYTSEDARLRGAMERAELAKLAASYCGRTHFVAMEHRSGIHLFSATPGGIWSNMILIASDETARRRHPYMGWYYCVDIATSEPGPYFRVTIEDPNPYRPYYHPVVRRGGGFFRPHVYVPQGMVMMELETAAGRTWVQVPEETFRNHVLRARGTGRQVTDQTCGEPTVPAYNGLGQRVAACKVGSDLGR